MVYCEAVPDFLLDFPESLLVASLGQAVLALCKHLHSKNDCEIECQDSYNGQKNELPHIAEYVPLYVF